MENEKVIDWPLSVRLANNKPELAKDLLNLLIAELPQTQQDINSAHTNSDYKELKQLIHKLHGACCYCGVPRLKEMTAQLEVELKIKNNTNVKSLIKKINDEITKILITFKQHDYEN